MSYDTMADLVLFVHCCYVYFVLFGQLLVLAGWALGWAWTCNRWFRGVHLLAIILVVIRALLMEWCPLTEWEGILREWDHETRVAASPIGQALQTAIGYDLRWQASTYFVVYVIFAALVLATLFLAPPRWRIRNQPHIPPPPDYRITSHT